MTGKIEDMLLFHQSDKLVYHVSAMYNVRWVLLYNSLQ